MDTPIYIFHVHENLQVTHRKACSMMLSCSAVSLATLMKIINIHTVLHI